MNCPHCTAEIPPGFKFCGNCGKKIESSADSEAIPNSHTEPFTPPSYTGQDSIQSAKQDERREVAVLFADVKGYTSMSEKLDPEAVHEIMNACFEGLGSAIHAEGGHIDKYIGDNIMALFGAPVAHEDDPSRACRAALNMQVFLNDFAQRYRSKIQADLQMRIGIHWGLVVSGLIGSHEVRQDYSVMGDAVNLAARLESAAAPGSILVSRELAERTQGRFSFSPTQSLVVKGKNKPVEACTLLKEKSEIDQRGRDGFSVQCIGRDRELSELELLLIHTCTRAGTRRWIELRGSLGVGKTRIFEHAHSSFLKKTCLKVVGTAIARRRAFGLIRRLVHEIVLLLTQDKPLPTTREEFAAALQSLGPSIQLFLDALWYISPPSHITVQNPEPDPQTLRSMIEHGIGVLLDSLVQLYPDLIILIDSFELADEESAQLLARLSGRNWHHSLTFLITSRPEGFNTEHALKTVWVEPLDLQHSELLLRCLVRNASLPAWLTSDLLTRAAGNPLFLEELVRALIQQKFLLPVSGDSWQFTIHSDTVCTLRIELPSSIRGAMLARIDALNHLQREFICQCAIQGNEFHLDVVACIRNEASDFSLVTELAEQLESQGVLKNSTISKRKRYQFVQPLLQESCYQTLLLKHRKELHMKTAHALATILGGEAAVSPELLAYHFENAEDWPNAAQAYLRHADKAQDLFLNEEAIRSYNKVLDCLSCSDPATLVNQSIRDRALCGLSRTYLRIGSYQEAFSVASELITSATQPTFKGEGLRLSAKSMAHLGELTTAETTLAEALTLLENTNEEPEHFLLAACDMADICQRKNRHTEALDWIAACRAKTTPHDYLTRIRVDLLHGQITHAQGEFEKACSLYQHANELAERYGTYSERARAQNSLGNVERDLGHYEQAREHFQQALIFWKKTENTRCIAGVHNNLGNLEMSIGEFDTARIHQEKAFTACQTISNVHGAAMAKANLAFLAIEQGRPGDAVEAAESALEILRDAGEWLKALIEVVLGEALIALPDLTKAETIFNSIINQFNTDSHPLAVAGALRGLGRINIRFENWQAAENQIEQAIVLFEKLKRQQELGRTLLAKAELFAALNDLVKSKAELDSAKKIFTEIKAISDLKRTETILSRE